MYPQAIVFHVKIAQYKTLGGKSQLIYGYRYTGIP